MTKKLKELYHDILKELEKRYIKTELDNCTIFFGKEKQPTPRGYTIVLYERLVTPQMIKVRTYQKPIIVIEVSSNIVDGIPWILTHELLEWTIFRIWLEEGNQYLLVDEAVPNEQKYRHRLTRLLNLLTGGNFREYEKKDFDLFFSSLPRSLKRQFKKWKALVEEAYKMGK